MTLDEAITITELAHVNPNEIDDDDLEQILQLGLEALKRIKAQRGPGGEIGALGLPGETDD